NALLRREAMRSPRNCARKPGVTGSQLTIVATLSRPDTARRAAARRPLHPDAALRLRPRTKAATDGAAPARPAPAHPRAWRPAFRAATPAPSRPAPATGRRVVPRPTSRNRAPPAAPLRLVESRARCG